MPYPEHKHALSPAQTCLAPSTNMPCPHHKHALPEEKHALPRTKSKIFPLLDTLPAWAFGMPGCRAVGLSGCRVAGLSGCQAVGLSGCRTLGLSVAGHGQGFEKCAEVPATQWHFIIGGFATAPQRLRNGSAFTAARFRLRIYGSAFTAPHLRLRIYGSASLNARAQETPVLTSAAPVTCNSEL